MVFRREGRDRNRYFFVQYEARIPVYSFGKDRWRTVNPAAYFVKINGEELAMKPGAIYDIVITQPVSLERISIDATHHPYCVSGVCNGLSLAQSRKLLAETALKEFYNWLSGNKEYRNLLRRFRILDGEEIELFKPATS
jgi:hypothetical protein